MLDKQRKDIDRIDRQMVKLMEERLEVVRTIADLKKVTDMSIEDSDRESIVIDRAKNNVINRANEEHIVEFMKSIINISKNMQRKYLSRD